jgi:archaeal cell division control protein 6
MEIFDDIEDVISDCDEIFGGSGLKILKNAKILSPNYVPSQLIGRKKEILDLARIFKTLDTGGYPSNALVLGYPGSGKTVVTKFLLQKLMERLEKNKIVDHSVKWIYVSCKVQHTETTLLFEIIQQIDPETKIPQKGFSIDYYYSALWKTIKDRNVSLIIVLDEIDYFKKDDLLYNLSRAGESQFISDGHFISTIGISNDLHYGENLDPRVKSSMNFQDFIFSMYNADQIKMILTDRVKLAFHEGTIDKEVIDLCGAHSAKDHGDARKAIELLRASAVYAEQNGYSQLLPEHVDKVLDTIDYDRFEKFVPGMALHKKIVLMSILKLVNYNKKTANATEIKNMYVVITKKIGEDSRSRTNVANVITELKMIGIIREVSVRKGQGASGREFELNVPSKEKIETALYEDYHFNLLEKEIQNNFFQHF